MESSVHALERADSRASARRRWWTGLARTTLGFALLVALVYWGQIDLKALLELSATPSSVMTCLGLLFVTMIVGAFRWSILLRALRVSVPFVKLLHFVAIGILTNVLLLGSLSGDVIRGIYAWRAVGESGGRIAVSVLADRLFTLLAVLFTSLAFSLLYWHRMQQVPALAALGASVIAAAIACVIGACALVAAPGLTRPLETWLLRWPTAASLLLQVQEVILMMRTRPLSLLAAFALALVTQILTVFALVVLAQATKIGMLTVADYMF